MPPAICDSEDEEEILVEDDEPSQRSHGSNRSFGQAVALAHQILSGSQGPGEADGSSLSTGEINRQIADTTRGFFSSATHHSTMQEVPESSAKQKLSRRHTNVDGATATKPSTTAKRTPTTYGKSSSKGQRSAHPSPDEAFQAYCNDERASQESLSAAFLQPSDSANPTGGLPGGTLLQDFQYHDPQALFPDTGSTIPDNESSALRMVELAREPPVMPDAPIQKLSNESQPQQSSPFVAWSASENQTPTPKLNSDKALPRSVTSAPVDSHDAANTCHDSQQDEPKKLSRTKPFAQTEASPVQEDFDVAGDPKTEGQQPMLDSVSEGDEQSRGVDASAKVQLGPHKPRPPPKSSPMVIIPPAEASVSEANIDVSNGSRGRKRRSLDEQGLDGPKPDSEPVNPDDRAIGLPKELYKPRPSRRRATAIEEPIDYSIVPEKAAKRRRKTHNDDHRDDLNDNPQAPLAKATSKTRKQQLNNERVSSAEMSKATRHSRRDEDAELDLAIANSLRDMDQVAASKASPTRKGKESAQPTPTTPRREAQHDPPRPMASPLSPPVGLKDKSSALKTASTTQQPVVTSPTKMLPPPLPASASRKAPRRSQTTIFEDHAASRSPSLSQQQAERLATVKDVTKSTQSNKRKRRTIVQNDEEEEDELAKVSPAKKPAPKKRGRPSKAETAAEADASRKALAHAEDEELVVQHQQLGEKAEKRVSTPQSEADAEDYDIISHRRKSTKRKSSALVLEDTEDELEAQEDADTISQLAKKNGRGRPKKTILEDCDAESVLDDETEHYDAQPKNQGPGRPAKVKANGAVASKEKEQSTSTKATPSAALIPKDANANAATRGSSLGSKEPTPAPSIEKPAPVTTTKHTTPATDVKPSPNSHSPIKKNAKVIHRVGLGRRQRVQPLLKIIRPEAKARKEDATRVTTVTSVAELERKWNTVEE